MQRLRTIIEAPSGGCDTTAMPPKRTASKPAAPAATPSPAQQLKTPSPDPHMSTTTTVTHPDGTVIECTTTTVSR